MNRRRLLIQTGLTLFFTAGLTGLIVYRWGDVSAGLSQISLLTLSGLVLLQLASYLVRVHAWQLSLRVGAAPVEAGPLHLASGAAFLVNTFAPVYLGQVLRIFILRHWSRQPPSVAQMAVADFASLFIEAGIVLLILVVSISLLPFAIWPLLITATVVGLGMIVIVKLRSNHQERSWVQALNIFAERRKLAQFSGLLAFVVLVQPVRFWMTLQAIGDPQTIVKSALAFIGTSVSAVVPVGPAASSVGGISAATGSGLTVAVTAGLILMASAAVAAGIYLIIGGGASYLWRNRKQLPELEQELARELGHK